LCVFGILIGLCVRFEKNDILRIVRALAIVRPSLIALQMPLTEEDEVFVEKCFQRSLLVRCPFSPPCYIGSPSFHVFVEMRAAPLVMGLKKKWAHHIPLPQQEFEKLISFSGTPTVGWRRTGEICLVGAEFSMLTDWTQDELVGGKKYIWEVRSRGSRIDGLDSGLTSSFIDDLDLLIATN
jgi:hypothetical protein